MNTFISVLLTFAIIALTNHFTEIEISGFGALVVGTICCVCIRHLLITAGKIIKNKG
jgi:hypothetical protein